MSERFFGTWVPGQETHTDVAVEQQNWDVGGTAHLLPEERRKASFDVTKLTSFLDDDDSAKTKKRRWLWAAGDLYDHSKNSSMSRTEKLSWHIETFIGIHKEFADKGYRPEPDEVMMMSNVAVARGGFGLHFGAFTTTIMSQATPQQVFEWALPAYKMGITGALAQTELGHGSNVRALQTTAIYDKDTEEFVVNTPTLRSMKWWPGNMGKTANFALVYANLIMGGEEKGFNVFMVQLRDENHLPLAGVTVHEVGPKIGDNFTDTGVLRLKDVRVPRMWMMMKHQQVTKDGVYKKNPKTANSKIQYSTMLTIRSGLVASAGYRLGAAVTIAVRYSCVRQQGFVDTASNQRDAPENKIIEYQVQQYRVLKQLAKSYAFLMTGKFMVVRLTQVMKDINENDDASELPAIHAMSAGLKALTTLEVADGMEDCRKCCGGHGVLLSGGIAEMARDYTTYVTAEGDMVILHLQTARYLMKALKNAKEGEPVPSVCDYLARMKDASFDPSSLLRVNASSVSSETFKDLGLLTALFRARALNHVADTGDRLAASLKSGMSYDEAWNKCAVTLVRASKVHCYALILNYFVNSLERVKDHAVAAALTALARLYALQNLSEDMGSFELTRKQRLCVDEAITEILPIVLVTA